MKTLHLISAFAVLCQCLGPVRASSLFDFSFRRFLDTHQKSYDSLSEAVYRQGIFYENMKYIDMMNKESQNGVVYGMNQFGDLTAEEFDSLFKGRSNTTTLVGKTRSCKMFDGTLEGITPTDLPDAWDWRDYGAVTPVKNQGQCGSCWSFSATGAMEGAWAISTGRRLELSEQQIMDCSKLYGNFGCNGGLMDNAFEYAIDYGMCAEDAVPYTAEDGTCTSTVSECTKLATFGYCMDVPENDQLMLKRAVFSTPVSVSIEADTRTFQFYKSGVLDSSSCGTTLDHGVLAVGYGIDSVTGQEYWVVKNSWGEDWGQDGYVYIGRSDSTSDEGVCGIAKDASFIVADP